MTPQQRCRATISNQPVDRAPTYIPAIACEVASQILGRPAYTGTGSLRYAEVLAWSYGQQAHDEFEQQMLQDVRDLYRALEIDVFRMPWRMNVRPTKRIDDYTFMFGDPDGLYSVWQYNPDSADFSEIRRGGLRPTAEDAIRDEVERDEANRPALAEQCRATVKSHQALCRQMGDEFFVVSMAGGIGVGTEEDDLLALALEPAWMARRLMLQADAAIAIGQALTSAGCPGVMLGGSDMAGKDGPIYSPAAFREVVLPAYRRALAELNRLGIHYAFRSDGNLWAVTDMLFGEAQCPGYGETDRDASMTVAALRNRFPSLVIWGNFSSASLCRLTPQQVRDDARRILDESGGRGYFQACSNAIVKGTPVDCVIALYEVRA